MGRLLPRHPSSLLLLAAAVAAICISSGNLAAVRCAPVYRPDYLVDGNQLVDMQYHMGPVVSGSPTNLYLIWYGRWEPAAQAVLRDFLASLSAPAPFPAVSDWWARTPRMYADQTGANVTGALAVAGEHSDAGYSHGASLRRIDMQSVIRSAVYAYPDPLPLDPYSGAYLVLTSSDVQVEDFCRAACGFHYFTFASVVGVTVPYAWVGNSGTQCPGKCAYPFAAAEYGAGTGGGGGGGQAVLRPPNGDVGVDGMVIVLGHELAEMATNPLVNAWYAGDTPTAPTEIADLCLGVYGDGGGAGGLVGNVSRAPDGSAYNVNGVDGRRFLVQWLWNTVRGSCYGPNSSN
ncbi:Protein EXORDIUM-like 5 [Dichanthelium oligosanthes]|uniref:Protein EXORDIUM-like 5 n=1 Tax=Dichanthelium oligosanthes TaxID=888268 RepID=A0A1E5WBP3_9POAL|nr:Protein EXORDIUM-like 5 [Dichanthelium oligosanthes]